MRRAGNLYHEIAGRENLLEAFRKAARGKRADESVVAFSADFETRIEELRRQILTGRFDLGHHSFFTIHDPKTRRICAPSFAERVLHHAVMNVCEPVFESFQIHDSYACRKGKGGERAVARARQFAGQNAWYLKLDIAHYFDSIDHKTALRLLARRFKDAELLELFARLLDSYHTEPGKGVPIGSLFSQHLANYYLAFLDHWLKEERQAKAYIRYMDDFVLFADSKDILTRQLAAIREYLGDNLLLTLKGNIQINRTELGLPFLGFRIFPGHVRLLARSKYRFSRKFREYERSYLAGLLSERELAPRMQALTAFVDRADSLAWRRRCIGHFGVLS